METSAKLQRLQILYIEIQDDPHYRSDQMGTLFVPGCGSVAGQPIVFVGEAPGREEERERRPFVGAAGKNFNGLLSGVGLSRDEVFVTNLIKYRPRTRTGANRAPSPDESRYALDFLLKELEILSPRIVVCLGLSAAKALLDDPSLKMATANGMAFSRHGLKILVTYHPSPYNFMNMDKKRLLQAAFTQLRHFRS